MNTVEFNLILELSFAKTYTSAVYLSILSFGGNITNERDTIVELSYAKIYSSGVSSSIIQFSGNLTLKELL
jgi:hypothetical protein